MNIESAILRWKHHIPSDLWIVKQRQARIVLRRETTGELGVPIFYNLEFIICMISFFYHSYPYHTYHKIYTNTNNTQYVEERASFLVHGRCEMTMLFYPITARFRPAEMKNARWNAKFLIQWKDVSKTASIHRYIYKWYVLNRFCDIWSMSCHVIDFMQMRIEYQWKSKRNQ